MWGAVLGDEKDPDAPVSSTIFNVDVTSLELNKDEPGTANITPEARDMLYERCQSVSITKDTLKYRSIKLMTMINANGDLVASVAILKDSNVENEALWNVR